MMPGKEVERRPYLILSGQISRRDGPPARRSSDDGKTATSSKKSFVHYRPKSADHPDAINQVLLTEAEARAFGLHKLKGPLLKTEYKTGGNDDGAPEIMSVGVTPTRAQLPIIRRLIEMGENASTNSALSIWRREVVEARVLDRPYRKKETILEELHKVEAVLTQNPGRERGIADADGDVIED